MAFEYSYTGGLQSLTITRGGNYIIEAWGASGGYGNSAGTVKGGYGGYSIGTVTLAANDVLYICVGGQGQASSDWHGVAGGYNGGGNGGDCAGSSSHTGGSGGGGATHVALNSNRGVLSQYEGHEEELVIVAGGGGGNCTWGGSYAVGHGGGFKGTTGYNSATGGTQDSGYAFGQGQNGRTASYWASSGAEGNPGAGGGFYGGTTPQYSGGSSNAKSGGGSGYIGNSILFDKHMTGYNVETSTDPDTYTNTTTDFSTEAISDTAKEGDGFVRITYLYDVRFLIEDANGFYDSAGNSVPVVSLNASAFQTYGSTDMPTDTVLLGFTDPKVYKWFDSDVEYPRLRAHETATPLPQILISGDYDMTDPSILGIEDADIIASSDVLFAISTDQGVTWKAHNGTTWITLTSQDSGMNAETFNSIGLSDWATIFTGNTAFRIRAVLPALTSYIESVIINFVN